MDYFSPINIGIFLVDIALAVHCIRSGRSPLWILALSAASFFSFLALIGVWAAYLAFAVIPDFLNSHGGAPLHRQRWPTPPIPAAAIARKSARPS